MVWNKEVVNNDRPAENCKPLDLYLRSRLMLKHNGPQLITPMDSKKSQ